MVDYRADVTSRDANERDARQRRPVWIPVAAAVLSGLVVNWLSDEIRVSPPILIVLAAVTLVLLAAAERSTNVDLPFRSADVEMMKLALLALLIGASVGALAVMPLMDERRLIGPWGYFHNYELGAAIALVCIASVSALRRRDPAQWMIFLAGSIAGMSLSVVYLKPGNAFVPTFAGWLIASALATTLVANAREFASLFLEFLGFNKDRDEAA